MTQNLTIVDDRFSLVILGLIRSLGDKAFGMSIQGEVIKKHDKNAGLVCIYEVLIDLLYTDRITFRLSDPENSRSRKIYELIIPQGMTAYGATHPDYPHRPKDWDNGPVLHISGEVAETHGVDNDLAWYQDESDDGTNIVAYTSTS